MYWKILKVEWTERKLFVSLTPEYVSVGSDTQTPM